MTTEQEVRINQYSDRHYTYTSDTKKIWREGEFTMSLNTLAEDLEVYEVFHQNKFVDCDKFIDLLVAMNVGECIGVVVVISEIDEASGYEVPECLENAIISRVR